MEKQAGLIARLINEPCGKKLSQKVGRTLTGTLTEDGVTKIFYQASKKFNLREVIDIHVKCAYVTSDTYNFLIDSKLATTAKNSSVNVDQNTLYSFKRFLLHEVPDARFTKGENAYFIADNISKAFAGFNEYRALTDNLDFFGVAMQSIIKYGTYVPDNNSKAIVKGILYGTGAKKDIPL